MRVQVVCAAFVLASSGLLPTTLLYAAPGDVGASFDLPCKYPAGLACDGEHFYVVDWRTAQIHVLATADGKPQPPLPAPTLRPHGLAWHDGRLYVSDDHSGWIYVLNVATGIVERSFEAPGAQPVGLAYAADGLFVMERKSGQIYKVAPQDGTILAAMAAPTKSTTCLTYDGTYLWASDRIKNELYMVDPRHGSVVGILDAPGPYAAGLAWHAGQLWNVDFQERKLYQLVVQGDQKYRLTDAREARVEFHWALYNYGPADARDVRVNLAIPEPMACQELLSELEFSAPPARFAQDRWGQNCAVYEIADVSAGQRQALTYSVQVRLSAIRFLIIPEQTGRLEDIPPDVREPYTADGERYRIRSPFIEETVKKVVGDEKNPYWIARKIYDYVIDRLEYEMIGGWDIPEVVLKRGRGSCSEYTFTFIALCRAAGLPARYRGSVAVRGDDASVDEDFHRWAEVYLPNYGWVPVDANRGDKAGPAEQAHGLGETANHFLVTTQGGGESELLGWDYNCRAQYTTTGYAKIEQENLAFWEPLKPAAKTSPATTSSPAQCRP